jgi:hypothetical protein
MKLGQGSTHPGMNERSSGFDDDGDAVVVAVDEPVEGHRYSVYLLHQDSMAMDGLAVREPYHGIT